MRSILWRIAIWSIIITAIDATLLVAVPWLGPMTAPYFGTMLAGTGVLVLALGGMAYLGPSSDSTSEIRPMQGNAFLRGRGPQPFTFSPSGATLVSSGTRSLWDSGVNPALRPRPPKGVTALGVGVVLCVLGLALRFL